MNTSLQVQSTKPAEVINITDAVRERIGANATGLLFVGVPHTTAAVFLGEDDEELREDIVKIATSAFAPLRPFKHIKKQNPNTEAHVFSSLFGTSLVIRVKEGKLVLGTYQNILFMELDGPKERTVELELMNPTT